MAETDSGYHNDLIIDQFTKQAIPFTQNAAHSAEYAIKRLVTLSNVSKKDHVTGIDITPAMIEQANLLRQQKNLCNIKCEIGDVTHLPYGDESFSIMITRYSFHHRVDPYSVLSEMKRVSIPKGRVVVIDDTPASDRVDMYNYVEKLHDPSRGALTFAEQLEMFKEIGLTIINTDSYGVEMDLERLLQSSFPNPGDKDKIRQLLIKDVQNNILGVNSYYIGLF